jgi:hypothetical protein
MKRMLVAAFLVLIPAAVWAAPLRGVRADPATLGCVFDPTCVISDIVDTADKLDLPGAATGGLLHTRTFPGKPGSQAAGLHAYLYRIDLTNARGTQTTPMVQTFTADFGNAVPLDYDGDGKKEDYFVVNMGGATGGMAPDYADQTGYRLSFHFYDGVPVGQSSMFIGMAAAGAPVSKSARVTEGLSALLIDPGLYLPFIDPCLFRRPDLNDDFTPAERSDLDDLMGDYIDACVIGQHYTEHIHDIPMLLPWHRTYIAGLENYLVSQGHPEFVPFPKWLASNPIPAELQSVDPDCFTADTAVCSVNAPTEGPGDCAPLFDTTPNIAKPAGAIYPALCDYEDRDALTSGINGYHGSVHCAVGGAMCSFHSPSAHIFWGHHGNIDDIWREWECRCKDLVYFPVDFAPFDTLTPCRLIPCWVAWYRFEDPYIFDPMGMMPQMSGDLRGAPNDGIPEGGPKTIMGEVGTALSFDGVDDFVRVLDHPELNVGTEDMAIDLWAMTTAMGRQPLVEKLDDAGTGFSFFLQDGMPAFEMKPMAGATGSPMVGIIGPCGVADGKWHHLAVSVDRDSPIGGRLFVDGVACATFDPMPAQGNIGNSSEMWIGRSRSMAGARAGTFFTGALDEMDLFRRALKPLEVAGVSQAGPAGKPGALPLQTPISFREICNGRAIGEPGTRVSVPITLNEGDGVAGFQVDLNYNPAVLTPVAVMLGADTALAGGWSVVMAPVGPGVLRILGESNPPAGLGPGPKEMAWIEFDIAAAAPPGQSLLSETNCVLGDKDGSGILCRPCANPGVVIVRNASSFRFRPLPALVGVDLFDPLPFMAAVEALDSSGNIATGYGRTAMMTVAPGLCPADTLLPATLPFVSGLGGPDTFRVFCCPEFASGFPLALMASDPPLEITGTSAPAVGISKGDLDANGQADVLDVLRDVRQALGQSVAQPPPTAFQAWAGDMLSEHCVVDNMINVLDVLRVRNKSLGRPLLCTCGGPFAMDGLTVAAVPQTSLGVRLEKAGPRAYVVIVEGARDLGGLQFEIKGATPDTVVTPEGLSTGRGWQVFTDGGRANLMRVVAFGSATGGITGDGAVLKITGAGSPKIRAVVASDQDGREVPVR